MEKFYCSNCNVIYEGSLFSGHGGCGYQKPVGAHRTVGPVTDESEQRDFQVVTAVLAGAVAGIFAFHKTQDGTAGLIAFVIGAALGGTKTGSFIVKLAVLGFGLLLVYLGTR